jgi:hypothetical protein
MPPKNNNNHNQITQENVDIRNAHSNDDIVVIKKYANRRIILLWKILQR